MDVQTLHGPTAQELVQEAVSMDLDGAIISVRTAIIRIRERGPHLRESNCELVAMVVMEATGRGLFVAFDLHE
ncbi:hypothetical protein EH240_04335 [Mesorhizobium tamadayense]|uniref:Uncharacterized protein n=1 Tax=Mesorhizobium tamadayense TaxID=425306 RepID=A0A3P3G8T1_9HYPH|nr:hypothetical protein [Mesorhizobium tamadayense]RRI06499.1 hypothetical protein EH240_04335 [Mesorhizobium tamadayense]